MLSTPTMESYLARVRDYLVLIEALEPTETAALAVLVEGLNTVTEE